MLRLTLVLTGFVVVVCSLPAELPEPGELALVLNGDDFDDYLDQWLAIQESQWSINATQSAPKSGCIIRVIGDLGQPQPVYLRRGTYLDPTGNTGLIHLNTGEQVYLACTGPGRTIRHPNLSAAVSTATATCVNGATISGPGWLNRNGEFGGITCSSQPFYDAQYTSERCYNNNLVIRIGFIVDNIFHPLYFSCFDPNRLEVVYVWYEQRPQNAVQQPGVDRPSWLCKFKPERAGNFYPGVAVNSLYTQAQQKNKIASILGNALADKYITNTQFLNRGHLAAKSDFIFATGQRNTFWFVNAAPQWQAFNAGNWNWVEQNLRARIGVAGYNTIIYTGTFGVSQLRDENNRLVNIYLHHDNNNNPVLPVPLYFYKVVYEPTLRLGTAFIGINNPYYNDAEYRALTFCTDRCRGNSAFNWLRWQPDRVDLGYSFCCDVNEFRRTVPHLPAFTVNGLLS